MKIISYQTIFVWNRHILVSLQFNIGLVWFYDVQQHLQQYFSYIVAVSFIGGEKKQSNLDTSYLKKTENLSELFQIELS